MIATSGAVMRLRVEQLFALVQRHGATAGLDRIMVTAALTDSGADTEAAGHRDPDGIAHAHGLWHLCDANCASNALREDQCNPDTACARMLPLFRKTYGEQREQGFTGALLAVRTYLWTMRPFDYQNLESEAAVDFAVRWPLTEAHSRQSSAIDEPDMMMQPAGWMEIEEALLLLTQCGLAKRSRQVESIGSPER